MKILGINDSHNASACMVVDGHLVAAIQEERLCRVKNWSGFPTQSIRWVLEYTCTLPDQVDCIAFLGYSSESPAILDNLRWVFRLARFPLVPALWKYSQVPYLYRTVSRLLQQRRRRAQVRSLGLPPDRVRFIEHHLAHAASAYFGWGRMNTPVLVLTADGSGDGVCATVNLGANGHLTRLATIDTRASLGILYALVTLLLGMKPAEHETKVMGLAPYAPPEPVKTLQKKLQAQFQFYGVNGLRWQRAAGQSDIRVSYPALKRLLENYRFDIIAGGAQAFLEDWLCEWVGHSVHSTGVGQVALAGGVFMNVKANQAIGKLDCVKDLFVFPSCGDETGSIGAAWWTYFEMTGVHPDPLQHMCLGSEYTNEQIQSALINIEKEGWLRWRKLEHPEKYTAQLLARGEIIAHFQGRMEFGARALGDRSIFAHPGKVELIHTINETIKNRDFWMPFAPAILDGRANDYLVNPKSLSASYMTLAFDTTNRYPEIAAAIHPWDHTARPQIVTSQQNPFLYRIISEFEALTGCGAVLNTSFNLHGEPIVMAPQDALDVFARSGLKYMVIGSFLVEKEISDESAAYLP